MPKLKPEQDLGNRSCLPAGNYNTLSSFLGLHSYLEHLCAMQGNFLSFTFLKSSNTAEQLEILMYVLPENGFSGMEEKDESVVFYIKQEDYNESSFKSILAEFEILYGCDYTVENIAPVNWNLEWETYYYKPVVISGKCAVRSSFHEPVEDVEMEIIINPKMSFGTGHHATTSLAMELIYLVEPKGKTVLDMGCGTGILGILCSKLGAETVTGIDNDSICIENTEENCVENEIQNFRVMEGDATTLGELEKFDLLIANINKNVLLSDIQEYTKKINPGGNLLVSGFFEEDAAEIIEEARNNNLEYKNRKAKDNWCAIYFLKL